ncbi:MAG TPA: OB-fold domain-containing protein [Acidimicrobiia bacterium]|nr:OB-fold domain-containing protein [Acidimicrobiia bacterium]
MSDDDAAPAAAQRPLPVVTRTTEAFWTGGAAGELRIQRCQTCGYWIHPPVGFCPACESRDTAPEAVSGLATVASCTVNHQAWEPGLEVPYVLALVELDEQADVRLATNVVNCDVDDVHIGMRVQVLFEQHDDVWVPLFQPARVP